MKKIIFSVLLAIVVVAAIAFAEFFPTVIVTGLDGKWVDIRAHTSITTAMTALGVAGNPEREVIIIQEEACVALTVHANTRLKFLRNGSIANTGQLDVNTRNITAGDRQIFTGTGDIDFIAGSVVRSPWFSDISEALNVTNDDSLTLVISQEDTLTSSEPVGNNVTLRWEAMNNRIIPDTFNLTNLNNIEADSFQIFGGGAGEIDFLAGSVVKSSWFSSLGACITFTDSENVDLTILIDQPEEIDANTTIDEYQLLQVKKGCIVTVTVGDTFTIESDIIAGSYQIFDISGTVTVSNHVESSWFSTLTEAVASGAKSVHITPNTTYTLTATCEVSSGQTIYGDGDTSLIELGANIDAFTIDGKSNVILRDFKIDGKKATYATDTNNAISSPANGTGSTNIWIDNITIVDVAGSSIQILSQTASHSENVKITNCDISESGASGIICQDYVDGVIVSGNRIINYAEGVSDRVGIVIGRSAINQQVIGNYVESDGTVHGGTSNHGISLDRTTNGVIADNIVKSAASYGIEVGLSQQVSVTGNEIYSSGRPGITVIGDENERVCKHVTITGNTIFEPALIAGIYVQTSNYVTEESEDITIVGNTIHNNKAGPGIYVNYSKNGVVSSNTVVDSFEAGVYFVGCQYFNASGNLLKGSNSSDTAGQFYGVAQDATSSDIIINGRAAVDPVIVSTVAAGEDDLKTYTIQQETYNDWHGMRVVAGGTKTGAGGNKTIKFYIGASTLTFHAAANDTNDWQFVADIPFYVPNVANDAFRFTWKGYNGTTLTQGYEAWTDDTTAASVVMKITGECVNAGDSISQRVWVVEFY